MRVKKTRNCSNSSSSEEGLGEDSAVALEEAGEEVTATEDNIEIVVVANGDTVVVVEFRLKLARKSRRAKVYLKSFRKSQESQLTSQIPLIMIV